MMKNPDLTPATIPFNGHIAEWADKVCWLALGDYLVEETAKKTQEVYKERNIKGSVNLRVIRREVGKANIKYAGWTEAEVIKAGLK